MTREQIWDQIRANDRKLEDLERRDDKYSAYHGSGKMSDKEFNAWRKEWAKEEKKINAETSKLATKLQKLKK